MAGECTIKYTYDENGNLSKAERSCTLLKNNDPEQCAKCRDIKKNKEGKIISKVCIVCNLCGSDFQCLSDSDCGKSAPFCQQGECVPCRSNGDCTDPLKPHCTPEGCRQCLSDAHCPNKQLPSCVDGTCLPCACPLKDPKKPKCLKLSNGQTLCVQCLKDDDCPATKPLCDTDSNTCKAECSKDSDCPSDKFCSDGRCAECSQHSDCKDPQKPRCFQGQCLCLKNSDCPSQYPICSKKTCRECLKDNDCPPGFPICSDGKCRLRPCIKDSDCPTPTHNLCRELAQRKVCVGCLKDSDCDKNSRCDLKSMTCRK